MKKLLCLALIAAMLLMSCAALAETATYDAIYTSDNPIPDIAERVRPAVVLVTVYAENWDAATRVSSVDKLGLGSGCYIRADEDGNGGYILTNNHIVTDADSYTIQWLGSDEEQDVELVGTDDGTDIAVLHFEGAAPEGVTPIPLGDSDALHIGELAICIGNHGVNVDNDILPLLGTVTAGIISGVNREKINADNFTRSVNVIQVDAPMNAGISGGALLNSKGELVGIPTLKYMYGTATVLEGLGFCIPINAVKGFIDQIIETGRVVRPRIGLTITNIDGPDEPMKRFPPIGAQIVSIDDCGPCANVGLQVNDIITHVNDVRVYSFSDVLTQLDKCEAGDDTTLKIYRYYDAEGNLTGSYETFDVTIQLEIID